MALTLMAKTYNPLRARQTQFSGVFNFSKTCIYWLVQIPRFP